MKSQTQQDGALLTQLGCTKIELLGQGGEASVYALDENHIVRLLNSGASGSEHEERAELVNLIHSNSRRLSFSTPKVLDVFEIDGRIGTIEARYSGIPLNEIIKNTSDSEKQLEHVLGWLNAARQIPLIDLERKEFGDLVGVTVDTSQSFHGYWVRKLSNSLRSRGDLYDSVNVSAIAMGIPEPDEAKLVHLDIFSGNLLWDRNHVSAVLDFGGCNIMGDGRLTVLFAAVFIMSDLQLCDEKISRVVCGFLEDMEIYQYLDAAKKMQAAYWSRVDDSGPLDQWCKEVLLKD